MENASLQTLCYAMFNGMTRVDLGKSGLICIDLGNAESADSFLINATINSFNQFSKKNRICEGGAF